MSKKLIMLISDIVSSSRSIDYFIRNNHISDTTDAERILNEVKGCLDYFKTSMKVKSTELSIRKLREWAMSVHIPNYSRLTKGQLLCLYNQLVVKPNRQSNDKIRHESGN